MEAQATRSPSRSLKCGFSGSFNSQYHNGSTTASFSTSMGRFDTCILKRETVEPQSKHTRYKLEVDGGTKKWVIYRRYRDFILLNKKLKNLFPNFVLTLPPKRMILDNFNEDFIQKRQEGLLEYVRNVLNHADMSQSVPVQQFFRLNNPPQPNECLEASQNYNDELEHQVVELKLECRELDDEINSLKNDLESSHHTREEAKGFANHLQTQFSTQDTELQELNQQVATAQCNELGAREELAKLREEIRAEREHVQATRDLEKQKQESSLKKQQEGLRKKSKEVNDHLANLVELFSKLPKLNISFGGKSIEVKTGEEMIEQTSDLKQAVETLRQQQEDICKEIIEMYSKETQELNAELARCDFITKTRSQEAETLRAEMKEMQMKYTYDLTTQGNLIQNLQLQVREANIRDTETKQKYFYALVLGVKLNLAICGYTIDELNQMKPQSLFNRAKVNGIKVENWPGWVSRELASSYPIN